MTTSNYYISRNLNFLSIIPLPIFYRYRQPVRQADIPYLQKICASKNIKIYIVGETPEFYLKHGITIYAAVREGKSEY